ncbi:bifunctional phosphoribosyl-AMP cyclohydrolase/phosphoribosyl-ATP diphosphatase HisIE [Staphylococcus simiae]|nr:bifunctional phosphoribosyl-AMP cyclohydrolase/phosphoribosyl-ATP diphosphatase HisIE [Staphylococcus simiae]MBO1201302.1 bifunctional phosphoribosyl-AMP cyclohydrolase/phosphoribosyl-ATP diphosphatase HisIE [Staphylococcus simiae]MBO1203454.1 bifunctional phosphoribosyl-AMP cyclohydrolase/phosphoribosyl-ATP diphosphatase HisIE [Staphylococcus simiae]MBO1210982.1 bifunctional phosphoribosyl-AMP cyclohydrolase/phosphoribosyl-ATP diphosphatase HisIE [Staphylococcus simiae]MBO1229640.1 bifuncti
MTTYDIDFSKGLIPAILQDNQTKQVLMLGYMNEEAFNKTVRDQIVCFYSRSKQRLWVKGETSGHVQHVENIHIDCDRDTILIEVTPHGPTCHTGHQSCFNTTVPFKVQDLEATVAKSAISDNQNSYTKYLLAEGIEKITKKFGEEAFEIAIAAMKEDKTEVVNEVADELYHLFVLLNALEVDFSAVEKVLANRHRQVNNFKGERQEISQW